VLELQRAVGNRAVAAMLSRQPTEEKGVTMTAGLGDEIGVIPLDSYSWGPGGTPGNVGKGQSEVHEATISFGPNPASAAVARAAVNATPIPAAFISTQSATVDLADVVISSYSENDRGSSVTLNFTSMKFRK
jgi:hypothetical protein